MKKITFLFILSLVFVFGFQNVNAKSNPIDYNKLQKGSAILPDTIYVGQNEFVNSLSNNLSGLFYLINNNILAKDLIVLVKSDLIAESGNIVLNTPRTTGSGTHFIKILPIDSNVYTIRGSGKRLLQIRNVDSLIFGDSKYARPNLVFQNLFNSSTDTSFVFTVNVDDNLKFTNNITFNNCKFITNLQSKFSIGFYVKSNLDPIKLNKGKLENIQFSKCEFYNHTNIDLTDLSTSYNGIQIKNINISDTKFQSYFLCSGILVQNANNVIINNNTFSAVKTNTANLDINSFIQFSNNISSRVYNNYFTIDADNFATGFRFIDIISSRIGKKYFYNNVFVTKTVSNGYGTISALITSNSDSVDFINNSYYSYREDLFTTQVMPRGILDISSGNNYRILNNSIQNDIERVGYPQTLLNYYGTKLQVSNNHFSNYNNNYTMSINDTLYANNRLPSLYSGHGINMLIQKLRLGKTNAKSSSSILRSKGVYIDYINSDIEGNIRLNPPTIGAYELSNNSVDLFIEKILNPEEVILASNSDSVMVVISNNSPIDITNYSVFAKINAGAYVDSITQIYTDTIKAYSQKTIIINSLNFNQINSDGYVLVKAIHALDTILENNTLTKTFCYATESYGIDTLLDSTYHCANTSAGILFNSNKYYRTLDWYDQPIHGNYLGRGILLENLYDTIKTYYAEYTDNREYIELNTTKNGSSNYRVIMFTVKNSNTLPITIDMMYFNMLNSNSAEYNVYVRNGNYVGFETNSAAWTFFDKLTMSINGTIGQLGFNLGYPYELKIMPGDSLSFYISWAQSGSSNYFICQNNVSNYTVNNKNVILKCGSAKTINSFSTSATSNVVPNIDIYTYKTMNCVYGKRMKIKAIPMKSIHNSYLEAFGNNLKLGAGTYESPDTLCSSDTIHFKLKPVYSYPNPSPNDWYIDYKSIFDLSTRSGFYNKSDTSSTISYKFIQNKNKNTIVKVNYRIRDNRISCYVNISRHLILLQEPIIPSLGNDTILCNGDSLVLSNKADKNQKFIWSTGDTTRSIVVKTPGTYYLEVDFANCRKLRDSVTVSFKDQLDSLKIEHWVAWCLFQFRPDTFLANTSYYWDFGDNQFSTDSMPFHRYNFDGIYKVKLRVETDKGVCLKQDTTSIVVYSSCFVGLEQNDISNISIYPNPTKNKIYITGLEKETSVYLFDIQSKLINTYLLKDSGELDMTDLNSGIYILKLDNLTRRIIKY